MSPTIGPPPSQKPGSTGGRGDPPARGRPAPPRRDPRRNARRSIQVRRNAFVIAWLVTAALLAALVIAGPLADQGSWLPLHALLLGGIGSAITIWSAHFADTLLHRPALGGAVLLEARLVLHTLGAVTVLVGMTTGLPLLAMAGVGLIMVQALTGVVAICVQYRRAVAARMGALALHYAVALALLAVGAALGYLIAWAGDTGRAHWADVFYLGHTASMLLGFVGTTVLGTLTVLWPTMLRTKMEPMAPRWSTRGLPLLVAGTAMTASSGLWQPLGALGTLTYLAGACGVLIPMFITARRIPPTSFATASGAGAVLWLLGCVGYLGTGIALAPDAAAAREVVHALPLALGAGFALQILVAALSYLTPVMLGGGPAMTRVTNAIMDRFAAYRVTAANACLLLAVNPALPWQVRVAGGAAAAAVTSYLLVGMALCGRELLRSPGGRGGPGRARGGPGADGPARTQPPERGQRPAGGG